MSRDFSLLTSTIEKFRDPLSRSGLSRVHSYGMTITTDPIAVVSHDTSSNEHTPSSTWKAVRHLLHAPMFNERTHAYADDVNEIMDFRAARGHPLSRGQTLMLDIAESIYDGSRTTVSVGDALTTLDVENLIRVMEAVALRRPDVARSDDDPKAFIR